MTSASGRLRGAAAAAGDGLQLTQLRVIVQSSLAIERARPSCVYTCSVAVVPARHCGRSPSFIDRHNKRRNRI